MKTCGRCNETKEIEMFPIQSTSKDGRNYHCKACAVITSTERHRTYRGLVKMIYHNQRNTSKKMKRPLPLYTEQELFDWMANNGYEPLWSVWVASGYDKWKSPSIDRKDNAQGYSLTNIRLITWRENLDNYMRDNHLGVMPRKDTKPVDKLDVDGNFICSYLSAAIAAREMVGHNRNVGNITAVCHGRSKTSYGYKWRFSSEASAK